MNIEETILQAVKENDLSLHELARRTGISVFQLCRIRNGQRSLTMRTAQKLCDYFGLALHASQPIEPPTRKK